MPNCMIFKEDGLTGDVCIRSHRVTKSDSSIHVNATGSDDFDISVQISNDNVNWATHEDSPILGTSEARSPFLYGLDERYRYVRVCFSIRSGVINVEAFLA